MAHAQLDIAVVTTCYDRPNELLRFLEAFERCHRDGVCLIAVKHGNDRAVLGVLEDFEQRVDWLRVIELEEEVWWTGASNAGVEQALADGVRSIVTMNSDSVPAESFIDSMREAAARHPDWILAPCQLDSESRGVVRSLGCEGTISARRILPLRHTGVPVEELMDSCGVVEPIAAAPGNGVLWPREVFESVGLFDAENFVHYHADSDLILRAGKRGFACGAVVGAQIYDDTSGATIERYVPWHVWSPGSARYWRGLCTLIWRHGNRWTMPVVLAGQWLPFCLPIRVQRMLYKRMNP